MQMHDSNKSHIKNLAFYRHGVDMRMKIWHLEKQKVSCYVEKGSS